MRQNDIEDKVSEKTYDQRETAEGETKRWRKGEK